MRNGAYRVVGEGGWAKTYPSVYGWMGWGLCSDLECFPCHLYPCFYACLVLPTHGINRQVNTVSEVHIRVHVISQQPNQINQPQKVAYIRSPRKVVRDIEKKEI